MSKKYQEKFEKKKLESKYNVLFFFGIYINYTIILLYLNIIYENNLCIGMVK